MATTRNRRRPQSPLSEEICVEWKRLVLQSESQPIKFRQPPPEVIEGSRALHAKAFVDGQWLVSPLAAYLVASLGVTIALREDRYADGVESARRYFAHPDVDSVPFNRALMTLELGKCLVLSGDVGEGARVLNQVNQEKNFHRVHLASTLISILGQLDRDGAPFCELRSLVVGVLQEWKGHKRKAKEAQAVHTNWELLLVMLSPFKQRETKEEKGLGSHE